MVKNRKSSKNTKKTAVTPWQQADAHQAREAGRYDKPIPSREFLLDLLKQNSHPLTVHEIKQQLGLEDADQIQALHRRLNAMEREGQVIRNRKQAYGLASKMDLVKGRVIGHPDGFGFLVPDEGTDDLYLSPREMQTLLHGDRVLAQLINISPQGKREGSVVEILERNTQQLVGRLHCKQGVGFVTPDNKRYTHEIIVPSELQGGAKSGQIVVVKLIAQPSALIAAIGEVVKILGSHQAPGMEIDIAIHAHNLPYLWPEPVLAEIAPLSDQVPLEAIAGRKDIRNLPLVTIDGSDARDFDDAVYCKRTGKGWRLLVAIADVSSYVKVNTALDQEARVRGTSVYFPERVIPMLPEILSNGLCSLNPAVDRLCLCCDMLVNAEGVIGRTSFYQAVMRSQGRLIYDEVASWLKGDTQPNAEQQALLPHLQELHALYQVLRQAREQRGAIDFNSQETRIVFDENRKIKAILPVTRNDAHKIIEECMLAANISAARFLDRHKIAALFRVHEGPTTEKLTDLRAFLAELGLSLGGSDKPQPTDYSRLLTQIQSRQDIHRIETILLRSLSQAVYTPENKGHFGLAYDAYTHFTSPIRRYPDLVVHRAITHILAGNKPADFAHRADIGNLGEQCSMTERRADEASRDVVSWLKCEYMMDKIGQEFTGSITGVASFGIFVELKDLYIEGMVHVSALKDDYYHYYPAGHRLVGEHTASCYSLGDCVTIRVIRVNLEDKKIDFELVVGKPSTAASASPPPPRWPTY